MAREREITVTLSRWAWAELQRRIDAAGLRGERGAHSIVINDWLAEMRITAGRGAFAPAPPLPAAPAAEPEPEDDDLGLLGFVPETE